MLPMTQLPPDETKAIKNDLPSSADQQQALIQAENVRPFQNNQDPRDTQAKEYQKNSTKNRQIKKTMARSELLMLIFSGVIAMATVIYAGIAFLQWRIMSGQLAEMKSGSLDTKAVAEAAIKQVEKLEAGVQETRKLAEITQEALVSVQRAFVIAKTTAPTSIPDADGKRVVAWEFRIQWENSGNTPTRTVLQYVNVQWRANELPKNFNFSDLGEPRSTQSVIGPKTTVTSGAMIVPTEVIVAAQHGTMHLYFWGWATYRDIFPNTPTHRTEFCYKLTQVDGNPVTSKVRFVSTHCREGHNCIDEECDKRK